MSLNPTLERYWRENDVQWGRLAGQLGAFSLPAPEDFENSYLGLDAYLQAAGGITHFPAREVVKENYPWPPQICWQGILTLALIAERFRLLGGGHPLELRHWYRTLALNLARGGAPYSDHLWACGVDLDFPGPLGIMRRRRAQRWLTKESGIELKIISLGVGWKTLHVGLLAPRTLQLGKHRRWKYGSITSTEKWL